MEVDKIMGTLLTIGANSSTPLPVVLVMFSLFVHFHLFVEGSSWPLVLVMFSLFCPLPYLREVLEFVPITNTGDKLEHSTKTWKWKK
jgi:hypothetical protein